MPETEHCMLRLYITGQLSAMLSKTTCVKINVCKSADLCITKIKSFWKNKCYQDLTFEKTWLRGWL